MAIFSASGKIPCGVVSLFPLTQNPTLSSQHNLAKDVILGLERALGKLVFYKFFLYMMLHAVPSAVAYPSIDFYASPIRYVGLPHVSLAHRQANHACEGDWKHVSRGLKTDWGKSRRTDGERCAHAWMGEYWSLGRGESHNGDFA